MHGLWAGFLNLIHSLTYAQLKPKALDTKSCAQNQRTKLHFFTKKLKLFSYLEDDSRLENHSKTLPGHPGNYYNQNQPSILKELVEQSLTFPKNFHNRV